MRSNKGYGDCSKAARTDTHVGRSPQPAMLAATEENSRGNAWRGKKDYQNAIRDYDEAIRLNPRFTLAYYGKACCFALQGQTKAAVDNLEKALEQGFRDFEQLKRSPDLDSIRDDERFRRLIEKHDK